MNDHRCVALLIAVVGWGGCCDHPSPRRCDSRLVGDDVARITAVRPEWSRSTSDGTGVTVPLVITADVPCLLGGLTATATTSSGTIGGVASDGVAQVFLAPQGDRFAGLLEGEVTLLIPPQRTARVEVAVADTAVILRIAAPADASASAASDGDGGTADAGIP